MHPAPLYGNGGSVVAECRLCHVDAVDLQLLPLAHFSNDLNGEMYKLDVKRTHSAHQCRYTHDTGSPHVWLGIGGVLDVHSYSTSCAVHTFACLSMLDESLLHFLNCSAAHGLCVYKFQCLVSMIQIIAHKNPIFAVLVSIKSLEAAALHCVQCDRPQHLPPVSPAQALRRKQQ